MRRRTLFFVFVQHPWISGERKRYIVKPWHPQNQPLSLQPSPTYILCVEWTSATYTHISQALVTHLTLSSKYQQLNDICQSDKAEFARPIRSVKIPQVPTNSFGFGDHIHSNQSSPDSSLVQVWTILLWSVSCIFHSITFLTTCCVHPSQASDLCHWRFCVNTYVRTYQIKWTCHSSRIFVPRNPFLRDWNKYVTGNISHAKTFVLFHLFLAWLQRSPAHARPGLCQRNAFPWPTTLNPYALVVQQHFGHDHTNTN